MHEPRMWHSWGWAEVCFSCCWGESCDTIMGIVFLV
jgi:hypothetical protein